METVYVAVNNVLVPIPRLQYEDIQNLIIPGLIGGLTDPLGQLVDWLWGQIQKALGGIKWIIDGILSGVDWLKDQFSKIGDTLKKIFSEVFEGVKKFFENLIQGIASGVNFIKEKVAKIGDEIQRAFGGFFESLKGLLRGIASDIMGGINWLRDQFSKIGDMLRKVFSEMFEDVKRFFRGLFDGIAAGLGLVKDSLTKIAGDFSKGISELGGKLGKLGEDLSGFFKELPAKIGKFAEDVYKGVSKIFSDAISPLVNTFKEFGKGLWDFLGSVQTFFTDVFKGIAEGLGEVGTALSGFINAVFDVGNRIWQALQSLGEALASLVRGFEDFLRDPLQWFQKNLVDPLVKGLNALGEWIWNALPDWMRDAITAVQNFFGDLWKGIQDFSRDPLGWISARISEAWNAFVEWTRPVWEPIKNFIDGVWAGIQDFSRDPLGWISARLNEAWNALVEWTRPVWEPIYNFFQGISQGVQDFVKGVQNIATGIAKFFTEDVAKFFGETLPKFFLEDIPNFFTVTLPKFFKEDLPNWLINAGRTFLEGLQAMGDAIFNAFKFLGEIFYRGMQALQDTAKAFIEPFAEAAIRNAETYMKQALSPHSPPPYIKSFIQTIVEYQNKVIEAYAPKLRRHGPVTGEVIAAAAALAISLGVGYALAQTGTLFADAVHPFKNLQFRKLAKSVADSVGGFFIMSSISASFTFFVLHPMLRRFFGKLFRPYLPGPEFWIEAWYRQSIDEKYFREHMAELGYSEEFIDLYKQIRANLLTPKQLITLVGLGKWDTSRAMLHLRKAGWLGEAGMPGPEDILLASYELPTLSNIMEMLWRGYVKEEDAKKLFMASGRNPEYVEYEMKTFYKMPTPSDLVRFVVRDVLDPDDFKILMKALGYMEKDMIAEIVGHPVNMPLIGGGYGPGDWADAYWEAHWRLPSMGDVAEFFNRAVVGAVSIKGKVFQISEDEASKAVFAYATLHDYKPEPRTLTKYLRQATGLDRIPVADRDIVEALRYRVLTRIEQRFVRRWGLISEEDYIRLARAVGIDPYIKIRTLDGKEITMIEALAKAEFLQDLLEERTAVRTQVINAFVAGYKIEVSIIDPLEKTSIKINTLDVEAALRTLRFRPEEANWLKAVAMIRRAIELRNDAVKALVDDYVAGAVSEEDFRNELAALIDDPEVRNAVISFTIRKKARNKIKRMLARLDRDILREADTCLRLYENGFATRDKAEEALRRLVERDVITPQEAEILLSIADMRRKRELMEYALRALAKRVGRGEITPEEFVGRAVSIGVDKEFVDAILEVYVPFHTLSISGLLSYADEVYIPDNVLERKLKQLRVPPDEAEIIRAVARRRPIMDEIRNLGYVLQTLAQNLEVTPEEATGILAALGLTPDEIALRGKIFRSLYAYGLRKQLRRTLDVMLREQYQALAKGKDPKLITLDEYVRLYKAMGYPDEYIIARAQEIIASAANIKLPQFRPEAMIR